jgi:hypothetical protein
VSAPKLGFAALASREDSMAKARLREQVPRFKASADPGGEKKTLNVLTQNPLDSPLFAFT